MRRLEGRNAIITGASQGLGRAIAEAFVREGANVLLCARDETLLEQTATELRTVAGNDESVDFARADVAREGDIEQLVARALARWTDVHVLVNNAGVYGPLGTIDTIDWAQWVHAIQINLLGSIFCCRAILPHFKARRYGKIVQLSGGGATNPLPHISAYAASKAGVVRFTETLAEEVRDFRIDVNAIAPGALDTRLLDEVLASGPEKVGDAFYSRMVALKQGKATPLEKGAALCVFLASAASDGITGKLIAALWDPWERFPELRTALTSSDVYTLRRIVPKDRGLPWD